MDVKVGEMEQNKIKVAYFIGSLNRGGTETLVLDSFRKREYAPFESILIYRNEGELSEAYRATGVPMYRIKPGGLKIGYITSIRKLLKRERVDILHTQTLLNAFLGIFCTILSRVKLVATFHGFFPSFREQVFAHLVMWYADASVFVSGYVRDWYLKRTFFAPKKRCHVVYNGIDFSKFDQKYNVPDFIRQTDSVKPGVVKMAMVGNFVGVRSQKILCRALKALKDKNVCDFCFYFIGKKSEANPKLYDNCVSYCRDNGLLDSNIFFLGGRGDVPAILQNVDAFVYSTVKDTFGIAVIEAASSGLPVLVNDWTVMKEITCDGEFASYFKSNDIEDCCCQIQLLVENMEQRKKVAVNKSECVRDRYSIKSHINSLAVVYNNCIK